MPAPTLCGVVEAGRPPCARRVQWAFTLLTRTVGRCHRHRDAILSPIYGVEWVGGGRPRAWPPAEVRA